MAITLLRNHFSQLLPEQVGDVFKIMLGSKKISVVKQGLMLYSESPNEYAWELIM